MDGLTLRDATKDDLPFIIGLSVGNMVVPTDDLPDEPFHPAYVAAFEAIVADRNQRLIVAELDWDIVKGLDGERPNADRNIAAVPLPRTDPVDGTAGSLLDLWKAAG